MEFLLLIPILVLGALLLFEKHDRAQERRDRDVERRELLNRIQHPEVVPPLAYADVPPDDELMTIEPDEVEKVGTIDYETDG